MENEEKKDSRSKRSSFGYLLIALGMIFLFQKIFSFSFIDYIAWGYLWPTILIFWGGYLVLRKSGK